MSDERSTAPRRYRKRRRAELEQQTRLRITEAAVRLHGSVGPARTTISAVAQEAGVQRATVYRHFPTEAELFRACSAHWLEANPPPDPQAWDAIGDPGRRLRRILTDLYAWYRSGEEMLERTSRDAPLVEAMREPMEALLAAMDGIAELIVRGRPERGGARGRVRAAAGHAVAFSTWRSLTSGQGLGDADAVAVMAAMVEGAGRARR